MCNVSHLSAPHCAASACNDVLKLLHAHNKTCDQAVAFQALVCSMATTGCTACRAASASRGPLPLPKWRNMREGAFVNPEQPDLPDQQSDCRPGQVAPEEPACQPVCGCSLHVVVLLHN